MFCCAALAPLAYINLRAPYDSTVTASDASESGGGLSFSCGLTPCGVHASDKSVRGLLHEGPDDNQVLVISLFDGIGACRVALDILNAKVAGYISIESDGAARRVVESAFGSTEFVHSVKELGDAEVSGWACLFSRTKIVVVSGGPPCQGVSGLNASRLRSEHDPRSCLHHHVSRIRELVEKYFQWATTYVLMESVAAMSEVDRACMSRAVGILPFELDAVGLTPCRRARLFWFTWKVHLEPGVEIQNPLTSKAEDYGISFLLECPPGPYLSPGWALAGGVHQKLPTFATSQPKAQPGFRPAGIESCTARDLEHWEADNFRFSPYQYRYQHGLLHPKHGWRLPNVNEREAMLGFPLGYTFLSWSKADRKRDPTGWNDCRLSLLGNSWSVPVAAFLLKHLLGPLKLCDEMSVDELQKRCQPGGSSNLSTFLSRPPWTPTCHNQSSANDVTLIRKLGSLMSSRGTDVLLQSGTEPLQSYDRLRTSVPSSLWKWRTACGWTWRNFQCGETEHINRLELRALLTSVKWRALKQKCRGKRFLHLVDSLVSLHVVNKARSSSRKLRSVMKRISAWLLLSSNSCVLGYVDTGQNPADMPLSRGQKRKWSARGR